jgi:hypothetical protein
MDHPSKIMACIGDKAYFARLAHAILGERYFPLHPPAPQIIAP